MECVCVGCPKHVQLRPTNVSMGHACVVVLICVHKMQICVLLDNANVAMQNLVRAILIHALTKNVYVDQMKLVLAYQILVLKVNVDVDPMMFAQRRRLTSAELGCVNVGCLICARLHQTLAIQEEFVVVEILDKPVLR